MAAPLPAAYRRMLNGGSAPPQPRPSPLPPKPPNRLAEQAAAAACGGHERADDAPSPGHSFRSENEMGGGSGAGAGPVTVAACAPADTPSIPPSPSLSATGMADWQALTSQLGVALGCDDSALAAVTSLGLAPLSPPLRAMLGEAIAGCDSVDSGEDRSHPCFMALLSRAAHQSCPAHAPRRILPSRLQPLLP